MKNPLLRDKKQVLLLIIIIDLLFFNNIDLPLLPTMPISLLLVIMYCFFNPSIIKRNIIIKPFSLFTIFLLVSMIFGILFNPQFTTLGTSVVNVAEYNVKRTIQIIILFFYFFFVSSSNVDKSIFKKILSMFVIWYLTLGILSTINLGKYFSLHNFIYGTTISKADYYLNYESLNVFRYRYIFLDANTSIYFFLLITSYLLILNNNSILYNLFIHLCNVIAVFLSQSTGAAISTILFYLIYLIIQPILQRGRLFSKKKVLILIMVLFVVGSGAIIYSLLEEVSIWDIDFVNSGYNRISSNDGGGRFEKYFYLFKDRLPFLWGEGYVLIRENTWFRPHSDVLRVLYSYGLISFAAFIFMFRKVLSVRGIMVFLPAMMAFVANSLIDDQKLFALFLIIYAIYLKNYGLSKKEIK